MCDILCAKKNHDVFYLINTDWHINKGTLCYFLQLTQNIHWLYNKPQVLRTFHVN